MWHKKLFVLLCGLVLYGYATWYGADFHGLPTATCETYNMYAFTTACHYSLLGKRMEVTIMDGSDGSEVVICNDTGPFRWDAQWGWVHLGRPRIDLSMIAFSKLAPLGAGIIPVKIEVQD